MKQPVTPRETKSEAPEQSRDERISALAYQIWEEDGRPEGRSEMHWYLACEMIDAEDAAQEPLPVWLNKQQPAVEPQTEVHELKKKSAA